jgi:hypothetical protein
MSEWSRLVQVKTHSQAAQCSLKSPDQFTNACHSGTSESIFQFPLGLIKEPRQICILRQLDRATTNQNNETCDTSVAAILVVYILDKWL